ncbi:MAG: hypothetical protein VX502_04455 [Candidatus Thermoplasmatota archaeon]|nr:hypothetical protein [Candidatus Thermoplasmatota archaeon]
MSDLESNRRMVFWNATRLALNDGQISNGEKRVLVKLAHALRLNNDEPKMIYDRVVEGREPDGGETLNEREMRHVYEQVLEAMLIHTDRSDDVLAQIAFLRSMFGIDEAEHRAIARSLDRHLEEIVHRTFIEEFRMRLNDTADRMGEIFEKVNILARKEQRR